LTSILAFFFQMVTRNWRNSSLATRI